MKELIIEEISVIDKAYDDLVTFRNELLRKPLGLNLLDEDLSEDANDIILIAVLLNKIVGCVMLQPKKEKEIKLRQMAVAEALQGKGIGKLLVENAELTAKENGFKKIILHARITAKGFYESLGYVPIGEVFTEVTIPHIKMEKILS